MFQAIAKLRTRATVVVVVGCMVMLHFSLGLRGFMITIMLIATITFMVWVMVALGDMVMSLGDMVRLTSHLVRVTVTFMVWAMVKLRVMVMLHLW